MSASFRTYRQLRRAGLTKTQLTASLRFQVPTIAALRQELGKAVVNRICQLFLIDPMDMNFELIGNEVLSSGAFFVHYDNTTAFLIPKFGKEFLK